MKNIISLLLLSCMMCGAYAQDKPNFIVIYVDDMGYGDLSATGNPTIRTPNLSRMADEGTFFTNYYSASPACTASRYALLTGKYPPRSGFGWVLNPNDDKGIHPNEFTIAEYLKEKGYQTAMFGKWHLGSTNKKFMPLANGFDEYFGLPYSNDMIPPKYQDIALIHNNDTLEMNPDQSLLTQRYTEEAIKFIDKNKKKSFFVYLPYAMPHTPLHPGKKFQGKSERGDYGDVVEELDYYVGQIIDFLKQKGISRNTYVMFTSDNGPWILQKDKGGSAGLFKDGKGSTWEGGMRVPFILWGHKSIKKQAIVSKTFTALDIMPSIVKLSGVQSLKNEIDGIDLSELMVSKGEGRDLFFYYGMNHELYAVRKGKWKLHVQTYSQIGRKYFNNELPLLFNLNEDPSENYNLASKEQGVVRELKELIEVQKENMNNSKSFYQ